MAKIKMFEKTMDSDIASAAGKLAVMSPPKGMKFKVEVEFDSKIEKVVAKDPLLHAKMTDAVKAVYDDLVKRIGENLQKTDVGAVKLRDAGDVPKLKKLVEVVNKGIAGAVQVAEEKAHKDLLNEWAEFARKTKEYLKYRIKIVVTVSAAVAGLATSIGLMAATPFTGGASAAFAIIGMIKSTVTIAKEIGSAALSVEQASKALAVQLKVLESHWLTAQKSPQAARLKLLGQVNEYGAVVVNQFLGISQPSIKTCTNNLELAQKKLTGVDLGCHKLAQTLNKIMLETEKLKQAFIAEAKARLAKHPNPKAPSQVGTIEKQLDAYLAPQEKKVEEGIDKVHAALGRLKAATEVLARLTDRVNRIAKARGLGPKVLENLLVFTDLALSPLDGNKLAGDVTTWVQNFAPAAGGLAIDKISGKVLSGTLLA